MTALFRSPLRALAAAGLSALLAGCIFDQANRGTIVDNEVRVGILYLADGKTPAADARVRVYAVDHQPDTAAASSDPDYATRTDAQGRYSVKLGKGEYNILGEKDGAYSYQDSVFFGAGSGELDPDTLAKPGSVAGVLGLQPNHNPISCLVQALGTNTYANVDADGRFRLANLAAGSYTLRAYTNIPEYTALFVPFQAASGRHDTLPDTLRLPFTGIPVVTGLKATYDTAAAVVKLTWDPVQYRDFSEYMVFRDKEGILIPSGRPIGSNASPSYADTLLGKDDGFPDGADLSTLHLEYRVKVRNKSDQVGLSYGKVPVEATGPGRVRIQDSLQVISIRWDSLKKAERVVVSAILKSPVRGLKTVRWGVGPSDSLIASRSLSGAPRALDTVTFLWGAEGPFPVWVRVEDNEGSVVRDSILLPGNSAPKLNGLLKAEYAFQANKEDFLDLSAFDPDGDTLIYSLKNNPPWLTIGSLGDLHSAATNAQAGRHAGITLSVSDGRRTVTSAPFAVTVTGNPWEPLKGVPASSSMSRAVTVGSRVYLLGGDMMDMQRVLIYSRAKNAWSEGARLPEYLLNYTVQAVGGALYVIGGQTHAADTTYNLAVWALDTLTNGWSRKRAKPTGTCTPISAVVDGKIHVIGGMALGFPLATKNEIEVYDPAADTWTRKKPVPSIIKGNAIALARGSAVTLNGSIYLVGLDNGAESISTDWMFAYNPAGETWTQKASMSGPRSLLAAGLINGRIYAVGGYKSGFELTTAEAYDPVTDTWTGKSPSPQVLVQSAYTTLGDELLIFQGYWMTTPMAFAYSYSPTRDP